MPSAEVEGQVTLLLDGRRRRPALGRAMASLMEAAALPDGVRLRPLTVDDEDEVARLAAELGRSADPEQWRARLEVSGYGRPVCWGVEVDGRLVGQVLGHVRGDDFGLSGDVAWLEVLGVLPAWQRRGLARLLVEAFVEDSGSRGLSRVATLVNLHDQPLRRFFRSLGFRQSALLSMERRV